MLVSSMQKKWGELLFGQVGHTATWSLFHCMEEQESWRRIQCPEPPNTAASQKRI